MNRQIKTLYISIKRLSSEMYINIGILSNITVRALADGLHFTRFERTAGKTAHDLFGFGAPPTDQADGNQAAADHLHSPLLHWRCGHGHGRPVGLARSLSTGAYHLGPGIMVSKRRRTSPRA